MRLELLRSPNRLEVNNPMNYWANTSIKTSRERNPPPRTSPSNSRTQIAFTGIGSCLLAGSQSGEIYYFSSDQPERSIDSQDVPELLSSGVFRLASRS